MAAHAPPNNAAEPTAMPDLSWVLDVQQWLALGLEASLTLVVLAVPLWLLREYWRR